MRQGAELYFYQWGHFDSKVQPDWQKHKLCIVLSERETEIFHHVTWFKSYENCLMIWALLHKMKGFSSPQRKLLQLERSKHKEGWTLFIISFFLTPPLLKQKNWDALRHKHTQDCQLSSHKHLCAHEFAKKKKAWYSPCFGWGLHSLSLWCADLCLSCFVPMSHRRSLAASWSRVQEATWRICPQTQGDFPHATECLLLLHQLIRADDFLTQLVFQTPTKKIWEKVITFQPDNQKYQYTKEIT